MDEERTAAELLSDTNVELGPDGAASWTTPALLKSACKINIDLYPFDVQVRAHSRGERSVASHGGGSANTCAPFPTCPQYVADDMNSFGPSMWKPSVAEEAEQTTRLFRVFCGFHTCTSIFREVRG